MSHRCVHFPLPCPNCVCVTHLHCCSPQTSDLSLVFKESSPTTALIFVLSPGTDPAADLYKFADVMKFSKKMCAISLGQGQVCRGGGSLGMFL